MLTCVSVLKTEKNLNDNHLEKKEQLPEPTVIERIYLQKQDGQTHEEKSFSIQEIFEKNKVEAAILIYNAKQKKYYTYDENLKNWYKNEPNLYYVVVERNHIENLGSTKDTSGWPYIEAINEDGFAQYQAGMRYFHSESKEEQELTFMWFQKAVGHGYNSYGLLAYLYHFGKGVEKNHSKVFECFEKAIAGGDQRAKVMLGICYESGKGVTRDMQKAIALYKERADTGNSRACYRLATCYLLGNGIEKNNALALEWYQKAAHENCAGWTSCSAARAMIGFAYQEGILNMPKDDKNAVEWYEKALSGDEHNLLPPAVRNNTAITYLTSDSVNKNPERAFDLLSLAAEKKLAIAQVNMGMCHEYGYTGIVNRTSAFIWYQKAAYQGNSDGLFHLGRCFFYGIGVKQNYKKATELFKEAASAGNNEAAAILSRCTHKKEVTEKDLPPYQQYIANKPMFILSQIQDMIYREEW